MISPAGPGGPRPARPPGRAGGPRRGGGGRARIRYQGDVLAAFEHADEAPDGLALVVLVEGDLGLFDLEVLEQQAGFARIFARDDIDAAQHLERTQRDVAQVADGGGDEGEGS